MMNYFLFALDNVSQPPLIESTHRIDIGRYFNRSSLDCNKFWWPNINAQGTAYQSLEASTERDNASKAWNHGSLLSWTQVRRRV